MFWLDGLYFHAGRLDGRGSQLKGGALLCHVTTGSSSGACGIMSYWSLLVTAAVVGLTTATPLDDYVNKPDATYQYKDLGNPFKGDGYTSYFINMTSQTWLSRM